LPSFGSTKAVITEARAILFKQYAESKIDYLSNKHPSGILVERHEIQNTIGTPEIKGVFALFSYKELFNGKNQDVLFELHLFQKDKWLIEYWITYPKTSKDHASKLIQTLMEDHKNSQPVK